MQRIGYCGGQNRAKAFSIKPSPQRLERSPRTWKLTAFSVTAQLALSLSSDAASASGESLCIQRVTRRSIGIANNWAAFSYQVVDLKSSDLFAILRPLLRTPLARNLSGLHVAFFDADRFTECTTRLPLRTEDLPMYN